MNIRRLTALDAAAFQALRLAGLRDEPSAFGSSYEEERGLPLADVESRLVPLADRGVFGAFERESLVGVVALGREGMNKLAHKAFVWGLYVAPQSRGKGLGRGLLAQAVALARSVPDLRQVNLCVNSGNVSAVRLYESLGFKAFGHEPGAMLIDGELHDETHMYLPIHRR